MCQLLHAAVNVYINYSFFTFYMYTWIGQTIKHTTVETDPSGLHTP